MSAASWAKRPCASLSTDVINAGRTAEALEKIHAFGNHCDECRVLDFLAVQCHGCDKWFCHNDTFRHQETCEKIVGQEGGSADTNADASAHEVDSDSTNKSKSKLKKRSAIKRCPKAGCKKPIGLVSHTCGQCRSAFCMTHRHPLDHPCGATASAPRQHSHRQSCAAAAAMERASSSRSRHHHVQTVNS